MKKLLLLAHEFPPLSGGFVMRALKLSKYLSEFGWYPIILTAEPDDCYFSSGWVRDPSLLDEIEGLADVYRTPSPLERSLRKIRNRLLKTNKTNPGAQAERVPDQPSRQNRLKRFLRSFYAYQDQSGLWIPYAVPAALRLIHKLKVDAVMTTSPPHWVQVAGLLIKRRTGLPWVADFRDGWSDNPIFQAPSKLRVKFDSLLERQVLRHADAGLVVTNHMLRSFQKTDPDHAARFHLIRNGVDPEDFQEDSVNSIPPVISFVHLGHLGGYRDPKPMLNAFTQLVQEGQLQPDQFCIQFIGGNYDQYDALYPSLPLELIPTVSHKEAIRRMMEACVLMLVAGMDEGEAAFTGKVFEYLASRRPILALIPPTGELADTLRSYRRAVVVPPNNHQEICKGIITVQQLALNIPELSEQEELLIGSFNRRNQAAQLAQILDRITAGTI